MLMSLYMNEISSKTDKRIINEFEDEFASFIGTKYAIGTSMGRTALIALLKAICVKEGDEIILPAYICEVVPNAILKLKGIPKFVDINPDNYHISLSHLKSLINEKTKAIIINHIFGYPEDVDAIIGTMSLRSNKIYLIEDVTHALGAEYKGRKAGSLGDAAIFSLTKNMVNVGGGAITTNDQNIAENLKSIIINSNDSPIHIKLFFCALSYFDMKKVNSFYFNAALNMLNNLPKYSRILVPSYNESLKIPENLAMSQMQASIALKAINKIDSLNNLRNQNQLLLDSILRNSPCLKILSPYKNTRHVSTWYVIECNNQNIKNKLIDGCKEMGVHLSEFWNPLPIEQYSQASQRIEDFPNSTKKARLTLVFKMDPSCSNDSLFRIAYAILSCLTLGRLN